MTAPQVQPPAPEQASLPTPAPEAPAQTPSEAVPEGDVPWPPDPQTLIQLMMDARFSVIEEPAGEEPVSAEQPAPPAPAAPAPAQPPQPAPPQTQG